MNICEMKKSWKIKLQKKWRSESSKENLMKFG
jgi:hypothetical protein